MKKNMLMIAIICPLISLGGCKGEKGETGPSGPAANANVHSMQLAIATADWLNSTTAGVVYYSKTIPQITANVVNGGTVLVYYQLATGIWATIPNSLVNTSGQSYTLQYIYGLDGGVGGMQIVMGSTASLKFNATFKIVIIDGKLDLSKINIKDYDEVRKSLNLEN
jgi:hypothetical protein